MTDHKLINDGSREMAGQPRSATEKRTDIQNRFVSGCHVLVASNLSMLLLGCGTGGTRQMYPGPVRPDAELAQLTMCADTRCLEIDGQSQRFTSPKTAFSLLPGTHDLVLSFDTGYRAVDGAAGPLPHGEPARFRVEIKRAGTPR